MKTYLTSKKLSVIILIIASALLFCQSPLFSAERKLIKGKKFDVEKGGLLEVRADFGDVTVKSWTSDEVEIKIFGNEKTKKNVRNISNVFLYSNYQISQLTNRPHYISITVLSPTII